MKVSIIVPVYNTEKYIDRCINSILNQSFSDFELILINDGSKDESLNIMKKYEKIDKRIKVYDQVNQGPALTRNKGIKLSKGKYIMFIDSDDYIDENFVKNYYENIINSKSDIVIGGYKRVIDDKVKFSLKLKQGRFSKYLVVGPVCRMINRSFLIKNNIEFLDTNSSEDIYFNVMAYSKTKKIKIIDDVSYNYFYNSESLSNTVHKGLNKDVKIIELLNLINIKKISDLEMHQYFIIRYCIWYLLYSGKSATSDEFLDTCNMLYDWLDQNIPNHKKNKYLSLLHLEGEPFKYRLIIHTFNLIHKFKLTKIFTKIYCKGVAKNG